MKLLTDQVRNQYESDHISERYQCVVILGGCVSWEDSVVLWVVSEGGGGGGGGGEEAPVPTALFSAHIFSRQSLLAPHNRRSQKQRREDFEQLFD